MKDTVTYPLSAITGDEEESRIDQLERELAEAKKDAERYRWLRDDERGRSLSVSSLEWKNNAELSDAAIDAAMKECGK